MSSSDHVSASLEISLNDKTTESGGAGLRLVEDTTRKAEPTVRTLSLGRTVSCENRKYIRLYPLLPDTLVYCASGSISIAGTGADKDTVDIVTFTPTSATVSIPLGAYNIRMEPRGVSIDATGKVVATKLEYNAIEGDITIDPPAYAVAKVTYDIDYQLFLYTYAGRCPDNPPITTDASGMPLDPVTHPVPRYFDDCLIAALNIPRNSFTNLMLEAPSCNWSGVGSSYNDSDKDKVIPTLKLEIDPDYPIRTVASGGGARLTAECCIRVYPAGAGVSISATAGSVFRHSSAGGKRSISEVKDFTNSATAALDYPPSGSIGITMVGSLEGLSSTDVSEVLGPGDTVVDVTWLPNDPKAYTSPRPRRLGPNEIAAVDLFRHPVPCRGLVAVHYASLYDLYVYTFDTQAGTDGGVNFIPAYVIAVDSSHRASYLKLDPPSTKDKTKSAR